MTDTRFDKYLEEATDDSGEDVEFDWDLHDNGTLTLSFDDLEYTVSAEDVKDIHKALMDHGDGE